jgi:carbon-monoxide dehydrogenase medium subunit
VKVSSVEEALERLRDPEDGASLIAGGMVMVTMMKERIVSPKTLVDISKIPALGKISYDEREGLTIGATATHMQIESSPFVTNHYPSLRDAFHTIGNVRVRSAGTLGGNLAYAEPQCNPPAILAALGGKVHVLGPNGPRAILAEGFIRGIFESALEPGEIITHVTVPPPKPRSASCFYKFTTRSETDKPTAVVAAYVELDPSMRKVDECRIVVGAIGPKTYRCFGAEEEVKAAGGTERLRFEEIAERASQEFEVIEDANGPAWYKKQTTAVIIRDVLKKTVDLAKGGGVGG